MLNVPIWVTYSRWPKSFLNAYMCSITLAGSIRTSHRTTCLFFHRHQSWCTSMSYPLFLLASTTADPKLLDIPSGQERNSSIISTRSINKRQNSEDRLTILDLV